MTKDKALKMAIKALLTGHHHIDLCNEAINACKEALEQPVCNPHPKAPHGFNRDASHSANRYVCECEEWQVEQPAQEPVAWYWDNFRDGKPHADVKRGSPKLDGMFGTPIPLYTHPHQWQGLTDDEIGEMYDEAWMKYKGDTINVRLDKEFARAIEQTLRSKNHE
jgi:hypothetical protein